MYHSLRFGTPGSNLDDESGGLSRILRDTILGRPKFTQWIRFGSRAGQDSTVNPILSHILTFGAWYLF